MFVVSSRSLIALKYGPPAKLLAEELRRAFFCGSIRHYHISLTRRLNPSRSFKYLVIERNDPAYPKKLCGMILSNPKFASTFVIETPGKDTKSVDSHPSQYPATSSSTAEITDPIPEPPAIPTPELTDIIDVSEEVVQITGEVSFASLGLGGWTPTGIVESFLEYLHIDCGLPWWSSIALATVVVRLLLFPVVVISQRNSAKMHNNLPQLQFLQMKMGEARQSGDQVEAGRYAQELMKFMKEKDLKIIRGMLVPMAQIPIFLSFFTGLRGMANLPVPSMTTGGALWFTDLTLPDQYFLLPLITSLTLAATIEVGTDGARISAQQTKIVKYILRAMPVVIFPFTINFPSAMVCYWTTTNFVSLLSVGFLKIPKVRSFFKIEPLISHDPNSMPEKPKPFIEGLKNSWDNIKVSRELENRERWDDMQFKRSGTAPLQKTFKFDPTRPRAVAAKKSES